MHRGGPARAGRGCQAAVESGKTDTPPPREAGHGPANATATAGSRLGYVSSTIEYRDEFLRMMVQLHEFECRTVATVHRVLIADPLIIILRFTT